MTSMHTLYTVSRVRKDGTLYGSAHGTREAEITLCGKEIDHNWYITNNTFDGEITCKKCLSTFDAEQDDE